MKISRFGVLAVATLGLAAFGGCASHKTTDNKASMGAMDQKSGCCSSKSTECTEKKATDTKGSMGAMGEKKSGCCSSGASATCTEKKVN